MADDNQLSTGHSLISRLEQFKTLSVKTRESKQIAWLQFMSLWCEVLQFSSSDALSCYEECARLLPILIQKTDFYTLRKVIYVARENCFACITQLNQPHIKNYLLTNREQQELPENQIYYKHVYYLLLIASQTLPFFPFETIENQQFIGNHIELLILLLERVETAMPEHSLSTIQKDHTLGILNRRILSFFWNLSDKTVLIPILLKCDLAKRVVRWLSQAPMIIDKDRRRLSVLFTISPVMMMELMN